MTARAYWWDRTLQIQDPRIIWGWDGIEEIIDQTDAFIRLGKLSVSDIERFLLRLDPADRPLAAETLRSRGVNTAAVNEAQKRAGTRKKFPTTAVVVGGLALVGVVAAGALLLR